MDKIRQFHFRQIHFAVNLPNFPSVRHLNFNNKLILFNRIATSVMTAILENIINPEQSELDPEKK